MQQAKARLELIIPIALILILTLLYGLFNSLRDSLLALAGIPFSVAGGVIALYLTGLEFSISSAIGFVSLFGVSVMSGILVGGRLVYLWRAVDAEGEVLDVLVQSKRDKRAALKLIRKLLKKMGFGPDKIVTDDCAIARVDGDEISQDHARPRRKIAGG